MSYPESPSRLVVLAAFLLALLQSPPSRAADPPRSFKDVVYAAVDGKALALDLYLPAAVTEPTLLVWIHGGAWTTGSKAQYPAFLLERGFAVASVDFRSSNDARFPANIHDIKASIRFLRANASMYGYRKDRIGVVGASSGGHLAALVGVTNSVAELEGTEGDYLQESSSVQAAVSYFGATNLTTILSQSTPAGLAVRAPALHRLFGAGANVAELARLASPVYHVDRDDPPLLLLHGDQDSQMPVNQVLEMQGAFEQAGRKLDVLIVHGADHVAEPFFTGEPIDRVATFLRAALEVPSRSTSLSPAPTGLFVKFHVKPGKNAAFEAAFQKMQKSMHAHEPGNLYYDLFVTPENPQLYVIMERYRDAAAVTAHNQSEHLKTVLADLRELMDGPIQPQRLVFISAK